MFVIIPGRIFFGRSRLLVPSSSRQYAPIAKVESTERMSRIAAGPPSSPVTNSIAISKMADRAPGAGGKGGKDANGLPPPDRGYKEEKPPAKEGPARRGKGAGHAVE